MSINTSKGYSKTQKRLIGFIFILTSFLYILAIGVFSIQKQLAIAKIKQVDMQSVDNQGQAVLKDLALKCGKQDISECLKQAKIFIGMDLSQSYLYLNHAVEQGLITSSRCHLISHQIGAQKYRQQKGLQNILKIDLSGKIKDGNCITGFYHGAMIESAKENQDPKKELYLVMDNLENPKTYFERETVHGVGHSLFAFYGDIDKSLDLCLDISRNTTQEYLCKSGVFMQSFFEANEAGLKNNVVDCQNYDGKNKYSCLSSFVDSQYSSEDLEKDFFPFCESLQEVQMKDVCIEKLILNLSAINNPSKEKLKTIEKLFRDSRESVTKVEVLALASKYLLPEQGPIVKQPLYCYLGNIQEFMACSRLYKVRIGETIFLPKKSPASPKFSDILNIF